MVSRTIKVLVNVAVRSPLLCFALLCFAYGSYPASITSSTNHFIKGLNSAPLGPIRDSKYTNAHSV